MTNKEKELERVLILEVPAEVAQWAFNHFRTNPNVEPCICTIEMFGLSFPVMLQSIKSNLIDDGGTRYKHIMTFQQLVPAEDGIIYKAMMYQNMPFVP